MRQSAPHCFSRPPPRPTLEYLEPRIITEVPMSNVSGPSLRESHRLGRLVKNLARPAVEMSIPGVSELRRVGEVLVQALKVSVEPLCLL